jgi:hypothetical protein
MEIKVNSTIYQKTQFNNVVDTQFKQLIQSTPVVESSSTIDLTTFFSYYEDLFFAIPKEGSSNSHRYILEKTAEYLGVNLTSSSPQELLDEINSLNSQLLETTKELENIKNVIISQ